MTAPVVHNFPVRRPNFIKTAQWNGPDHQLVLDLTYLDQFGSTRGVTFTTRHEADGQKGEICLPASNDLVNLGLRYEDILTAHTRMACLVSRSGIPGSVEFNEALLNGQSSNIQTALGMVKVIDVQAIDDQTIAISYRQGSGPVMTINQEYQNLNNYVFVPDTQLFVIPGSVKKQFANYIHDYPSVVLSESRRQEIVDYVLTLEPWI